MTLEREKTFEELKDDYKQNARNHLGHMGKVIVNGMSVIVERNDWFLCGAHKANHLPNGSFPVGLGYGAFVADGHEFLAGEVYIYQRFTKLYCVFEIHRIDHTPVTRQEPFCQTPDL